MRNIHKARLLVGGIAASTLIACGQQEAAAPEAESDVMSRARTIAQEMLIVDTHIDMPYRMHDEYQDVSVSAPGRDFDFPRARQGGLDVAFMSIYLPPATETDGTAGALADELMDMVEREVAKAPDKFVRVNTTEEVEEQFGSGKVAFAYGLENGAAVAGEMANLHRLYDRGIRYITLCHSKSNHIADSSYDEERLWDGLSPFGEELVREMNRIGMIIDISHVSDAAFYDVMAITKVPPVATHSSVRHYTPGWERNMDDDMIRALAEAGGVININFGSTFVNQASRENWEAMDALRDVWLEETGHESGGDEADAWTEEYRSRIPFLFADLDDVLDNIDHVRDLVGVDYIGVGSDYDGVGDSLPTGLKDVSTYPNLVAGLIERGYSGEDIGKILGGNMMRVWREVEAHAGK